MWGSFRLAPIIIVVFVGVDNSQFSQNAGLKQKLMQTQGTAMVEASPTDTVWGIGLSAKNWRAKQRKHWRGKNYSPFAFS